MNEEQKSQLEKIKARAPADDGFKQKLFADPVSVLKAEGVEVPGPLVAANGELSLSQLDQVSAGDGTVSGWIVDNILGPAYSAIVSALGLADTKPEIETAVAGVRG